MVRLSWLWGVVALLVAGCGGETVSADDELIPVPVGDVVHYGESDHQFGVLRLPDGDGPFPVIAFIHGGFWRNAYDLTLSFPQADDARAKGWAIWNIEYRRVGDEGGGYPGTLDDVGAALDILGRIDAPLDLDRLTVVGHSAGGHLALWAGQRDDPEVVPSLVVGQAPVADFDASLDLSSGAVVNFIGATPAEDPEAYAAADPRRRLPVKVPQMIVHGLLDTIVPVDVVRPYVEAAGEDVLYREYERADHFSVILPDHQSWLDVLTEIAARGAGPTEFDPSR